MDSQDNTRQFEKLFWPHLRAAYNLARWLVHRPSDADDVIQESFLRALKAFDQYHGGDARAWLLAIVRNTAYTWLRRNRMPEQLANAEIDLEALKDPAASPEMVALRHADQETLRQALEGMPLEFREILVLRELDGLSYKEICEVSGLPMGTVMSRLARARDRLVKLLTERSHEL